MVLWFKAIKVNALCVWQDTKNVQETAGGCKYEKKNLNECLMLVTYSKTQHKIFYFFFPKNKTLVQLHWVSVMFSLFIQLAPAVSFSLAVGAVNPQVRQLEALWILYQNKLYFYSLFLSISNFAKLLSWATGTERKKKEKIEKKMKK